MSPGGGGGVAVRGRGAGGAGLARRRRRPHASGPGAGVEAGATKARAAGGPSRRSRHFGKFRGPVGRPAARLRRRTRRESASPRRPRAWGRRPGSRARPGAAGGEALRLATRTGGAGRAPPSPDSAPDECPPGQGATPLPAPRRSASVRTPCARGECEPDTCARSPGGGRERRSRGAGGRSAAEQLSDLGPLPSGVLPPFPAECPPGPDVSRGVPCNPGGGPPECVTGTRGDKRLGMARSRRLATAKR